jgi:hypothetical protein
MPAIWPLLAPAERRYEKRRLFEIGNLKMKSKGSVEMARLTERATG